MDIEKEIKKLLRETIREDQGLTQFTESLEPNLEVPKNRDFGDFSANIAFILAQPAKRPALEIAGDILKGFKQRLSQTALEKKIEKIEIKGSGFINFFLNQAWLNETLLEINRKKSNFGRLDLGKNKKIHLEFVSANPTGPLNVAHGRQAAFGDSLANLLLFSGYKLTREYYLNDEGVQIDILGESVRARYLALLGNPACFPANGYQGKYIDELAEELVREYGRRLAREHKEKQSFFSRFAYQRIVKGIKEDLRSFGVNFDSWFSQQRLRKTGKITRSLELLKKQGFIYHKDGAWWLASTKFGDDKDRVVIKSDSSLTYIAPDIAYHRLKLKRGFAKIINIWGPDHHGYIPRIKAAMSALGYDAEKITVLIVQLVSLACADKVIPMSTRAGQFISLKDIIQAVGKDAARFFFLMRRRDAHLHFDLELAKRQSLENPVYYIQYANARVLNILKFARVNRLRNVGSNKDVNLSLLDKPEELRLVQTLRMFPSVVESCALNLEPHRITAYLQELAKDFHCYYEKHRVVTQDQALTLARLVLVNAVRIVLANCLSLLSISAPEKM